MIVSWFIILGLFQKYCVCCFININYKNRGVTVITRVFTVENVKMSLLVLSTRILSTAVINSFLILVAQFTVCDKLYVVENEVSCFYFSSIG